VTKLFEYQGKALLERAGISVPIGEVARNPEEAAKIASNIARPVVLKAQAWVTGRSEAGGVRFAQTPEEASIEAHAMLDKTIKGFSIKEILVEQRLDIEKEFYLGMVIDDANKCPTLVFATSGGTGIEEIARRHQERIRKVLLDVDRGLREYEVRNLLRTLDIRGKLQDSLTRLIVTFWDVCRKSEARSAEINPLVLTSTGQIVAADCHIVIDDYAVFRHPELGIDVAREFDRPATDLERIAYQVESTDHRGTFYFLQMVQKIPPRSGHVGFHGSGGGGAMMSMDALLGCGLKAADYCDTSGNPSASKVYRAARIILSQPNIEGYFASGSGVASQEQFHSARGLIKAFREVHLSIPAVIRIGGNSEELAIEILHSHTRDLPGVVEAYGRDTSASQCAQRLKALIQQVKPGSTGPAKVQAKTQGNYAFKTLTGKLSIDHSRCRECQSKPCLEACAAGILKLDESRLPVLAIDPQQAGKGKCTECLACELACEFQGKRALYIDLPIHGLESV
jgi:succinyl-CoA synthetase beta subunit